MSKLNVFNFMTVNGYVQGPNGDISWSHERGDGGYAAEMLALDNTLLFGRVTYEMMASFWPTPQARQSMPAVAEGMNRADKVVFSRTLKKAGWNNTKIVNGDIEEEVRRMKQTSGKDLTLLGSGSILTQLAQRGLVDEVQLMVHPIALGEGTPIFEGLDGRLDLKLTSTRTFESGTILLCFTPAAAR